MSDAIIYRIYYYNHVWLVLLSWTPALASQPITRCDLTSVAFTRCRAAVYGQLSSSPAER